MTITSIGIIVTDTSKIVIATVTVNKSSQLNYNLIKIEIIYL